MILIAEDESYNQELLLQYMTGEREYNMSEDRIIIVNNGKEALDAVKKNEKIKVILMDVRMPGMNWYEATREIRTILKDIPDRKIKIIGQTAHAYSGDKQDCIAAGMDAYIAKPILMPKLNETIIHVVDSEDLTPDTKN